MQDPMEGPAPSPPHAGSAPPRGGALGARLPGGPATDHLGGAEWMAQQMGQHPALPPLPSACSAPLKLGGAASHPGPNTGIPGLEIQSVPGLGTDRMGQPPTAANAVADRSLA